MHSAPCLWSPGCKCVCVFVCLCVHVGMSVCSCVCMFLCVHVSAKCSLPLFFLVKSPAWIWSVSSFAAAAQARRKIIPVGIAVQNEICPFLASLWNRPPSSSIFCCLLISILLFIVAYFCGLQFSSLILCKSILLFCFIRKNEDGGRQT